MKNRHAVALSLVLGVAVVAGAFAVYQTVGWLDSPSQAASTIAVKDAELDRLETSIDTALATQPPSLPGGVDAALDPGAGAFSGPGTGAGPVTSDDDRYEPDDAYDDDRYEPDEDADDDDRYEQEDEPDDGEDD